MPYMGPAPAAAVRPSRAHVGYMYLYMYMHIITAYVYVYALCTYLDKNIFQSQHPEKPQYSVYPGILTKWCHSKKDARRIFAHFGVPHAPRSLI